MIDLDSQALLTRCRGKRSCLGKGQIWGYWSWMDVWDGRDQEHQFALADDKYLLLPCRLQGVRNPKPETLAAPGPSPARKRLNGLAIVLNTLLPSTAFSISGWVCPTLIDGMLSHDCSPTSDCQPFKHCFLMFLATIDKGSVRNFSWLIDKSGSFIMTQSYALIMGKLPYSFVFMIFRKLGPGLRFYHAL